MAPSPSPEERTPLLSSSSQGHASAFGFEHDREQFHDHSSDQDADPESLPPTSSDPSTDPAQISNAESLTTSKKALIMASLWVGVFFAALDTTVVATLITPISSSLSSLSLLSYLATGYLIANAACQPLSGKLTDIFSRRYGLLFSNIFFALGTTICGLAPSAEWLIFGRVVAGIGGGGLTCISTFVTSDLIPLRERGVWQGYGNLVFGAGMGSGGIVGGLCADKLKIVLGGVHVEGWRWAFLLQVPFVIVSAIMVWFLVDVPVKKEYRDMSAREALKKVDFLGAGLLVVTIVLLLLGLNTGGNQLPWGSWEVVGALVVSALGLVAFVYVEASPRWAPEPVIPVVLVGTNRTILCACLTNWFGTMSSYLHLYFVPLYLQTILGYSPSQAGLRVVPNAVATSAGSLIIGYVMRATGRYYLLSLLTMGIFLLGNVLISTFNQDTASWMTFTYMTPLGFGYGGMITLTMVAMISAAAHEYQAVVTAASYAFRSTGSTIGITLASAVFQNILTRTLNQEYGHMPGAQDEIERLRNSVDGVKQGIHLPAGWSRDTVLNCFMQALRGSFITGLVLAGLALLASLGMREYTLHKKLDRRESNATK